MAKTPLRYEVRAEYPYSTHKCDTLEEVAASIRWEWEIHRVRCTVRVVSDWVRDSDVANLPELTLVN